MRIIIICVCIREHRAHPQLLLLKSSFQKQRQMDKDNYQTTGHMNLKCIDLKEEKGAMADVNIYVKIPC